MAGSHITKIKAASLACLAVGLFGFQSTVRAQQTEIVESEGAEASVVRSSGFIQYDMARTYAGADHWSMARLRSEVALQGSAPAFKWKTSVWGEVDGVYAIDHGHYSDEVRRDQQTRWMLREAYLEFSAGDAELRFGRQHIVWGEMVGLFFADVVSARDMKTFYLPEFGQMRIPQWAARAQYFMGETNAELIWIPVPTYDDIGRPGGEFYPVQAGRVPVGTQFLGEQKPSGRLADGNWGGRLSRMIDGWDLSAFYYRSMDVAPTFYRLGFNDQMAPVLQARHLRIAQTGGTLTKDFGDFVLKSEVVHTRGRQFNTQDMFAPFGLVGEEVVDYIVGVDIPAFDDGRVNVQYFARRFLSRHDSLTGYDKVEQGGSLFLSSKLGRGWEAETLLVAGFNRTDYMFRPKLIWTPKPNWRVSFGLDILGGKPQGAFGTYDASDRVYAQVRWAY
ncbi:DUF1302 family protein [Zoogloea sp.]|uniref:DUF1302 family protein n=1 Tax=Zoogloea sp. TaxID=49181 RepID=UPI0035B308D1